VALSRMPQDISAWDWYYEERSHLLLVHQVRDKNGSLVQTDQIKIPWRMIERSRERLPKPRKRR